jgi:hypothetical protein
VEVCVSYKRRLGYFLMVRTLPETGTLADLMDLTGGLTGNENSW